MLPTELYKVFYYVAKYSNISKAANALYISQPAISKSIKKLENLTGCTLFIRSSKGVSLTTEGEILFNYVESAFISLANGEKIIEKLNNKQDGIVKIGISNTLCKYYFLPHLQSFHKLYPHIKIQIINRPSPETYHLLEAGKIDFGIISIPDVHLDYKYIFLMSIQDIFVANNKYYSSDLPIPVNNLSSFAIMMMEKENQTRIYIDKFLAKNSVELTPEIEISSMDFLIEFAKIGIGVACVIKEFIQDELSNGTLKQLPISPEPKPREIGLVLKENIPLSIAAKTFINFLCNKNKLFIEI